MNSHFHVHTPVAIIPKHAAAFIALGACAASRNGAKVRAALLDANNYLTFGKLDGRPKAATESDWRKLRAAQLRDKRRSKPHPRN